MSTQIVRVGNTLTVEVPEELLEGTGFSAGDSVEWVVMEGGGLALLPTRLLAPEDDYNPELTHDIPLAEDEAAVIARIRAGKADIAAGRSVSHERVVEWLDSWGTEKELPVPHCE